jgi:HTTM domain/Vitamin K-dependent gamma-carboxylase, lumenal domain
VTRRSLFAPVDPASLAFLRIAFGLLLAWEVGVYFATGRIGADYVEPAFHFTYLGFHWVRPWPGAGMYVHFAALGLAALALALGLAARASAAFFCAGFTYVFLLEEARYLNHFYLICLLAFLLAVVPAGRAFSIDALLSGEHRAAPAWALFLVRAQIGLVYLFAGIAKLNPDWLRAAPLDEWLADRAGHPVLGAVLATRAGAYAFSYGGLTLDLLAWPLLAWRPTRTGMFLFVASFHLLNATLFGIGIFPWLMLAATTVFLEPDWPRALAHRLLGPRVPRAPAFEPPAPSPFARRAVPAFVALYLAVQVVVPLRHLLYPGSVHWTEEGHMFSWHMKLRDKSSTATFLLTDPATGETTLVDPRAELTDDQARKMSGRPDMILQYAHHLAQTRSHPGGPRLQVHALVTTSLNGREPQPLVDPDVDLAAEPQGLGHARWIVPLETPLRPGDP